MPPWYEELFDERYLAFYEELTPAAPSTAEAAFVEQALGLAPHSRVLDLGCGTGRHSVALALRGHAVTGLDLSPTLLGVAERLAAAHQAPLTLVRRDLRDLAGLGPFDACVCLYTVFGYFDDAANEQVLRGVRDALHPDGRLLLDLTSFAPLLLPAGHTVWRESAHGVAREAHRYDPLDGVLTTERTLFRKDGGVVTLPASRVRAYLPHEVLALLARAGFAVDALYGDLADTPFDWERSRRHVYAARRADAPAAVCS
ncbi:MAG TPA: class I SAM-dependent methyltransferase [Polyangia bacterium]|jgi:SAM-dependent methyltransferase